MRGIGCGAAPGAGRCHLPVAAPPLGAGTPMSPQRGFRGCWYGWGWESQGGIAPAHLGGDAQARLRAPASLSGCRSRGTEIIRGGNGTPVPPAARGQPGPGLLGCAAREGLLGRGGCCSASPPAFLCACRERSAALQWQPRQFARGLAAPWGGKRGVLRRNGNLSPSSITSHEGVFGREVSREQKHSPSRYFFQPQPHRTRNESIKTCSQRNLSLSHDFQALQSHHSPLSNTLSCYHYSCHYDKTCFKQKHLIWKHKIPSLNLSRNHLSFCAWLSPASHLLNSLSEPL